LPDSPVVALEHVGKAFSLRHRGPEGVKERALWWLRGRRIEREQLWAVRDVSFEVRPGQMLGLIGTNGSGKSTLLQIIAGIYVPDTGSVKIQGRLRALLELGTGFSPDLSGRENIFLNASLLGFKRADVRRRFDAIVEFAELDRFIDMPLKTYSSGMQVRLGFATAIHLDPEILLLDEVLAVGDDRFQRKSLTRIREIRESGAAVIFISHDLVSVEQLCDRAGLVDEGRLVAEGQPSDIVSQYRARLAGLGPLARHGRRWGTGEVRIDRVVATSPAGTAGIARTGDPLVIRIDFSTTKRIERPVFGLAIRKHDGGLVTGPNTRMCGYPIAGVDAAGTLDYTVPSLPLLPGTYRIAAAIYD
jgi:ABC-type polysaccharide/polyol phosphate transport system ATPase subunit